MTADAEGPVVVAKTARTRRFAEDFESIDISFLKEAGLLTDGASDVTWRWRLTTTGHGIVRAVWRPVQGELLTVFEGGYVNISIEPTTNAGRKMDFICPLSGEKCRALFHVDGVLGSRRALGLQYRSEALTPLERKLQKANKAPRVAAYRAKYPIVVSAPVSAKVKTNDELSPLGTAEALRRGAATFSTLDGRLYARSLEQSLTSQNGSHEIIPLDVTNLRTASLAAHPRLEAKELYRAGLFVEGEDRTATGVWSDQRTGLQSASFCIDLTNDPIPCVRVISILLQASDIPGRSKHAGKPPQVIRLSPPDVSHRRLFLCPVTGLPTKALAFRDGRWASRQAQKLIHPSQRGERYLKHDAMGARDLEDSAKT